MSSWRFFAPAYLSFCAVVLVASSVFWSLLGARLQSSNADEAVEALLFKAPGNLSGNFLPGAHTFLIKWPLFWLVHLWGSNRSGLIIVATGTSVVTVMLFGWVLSRFERRPVVLGTLFLALASALLLVPPVPATGNLLPVNMAMLATRNIEYVVYISALWLLIRSHGYRKWRFWAGVVLLGLLIASDNLFAVLSIGAALGGLVVYASTRQWSMTVLTTKLLIGALSALVMSLGLLFFIGIFRVVHVVHAAGGLPYGAQVSAHGFVLGLIYAVISIATNMGANPAYETTVLQAMPRAALDHIWGWAGPALLCNIVLMCVACAVGARLFILSLRRKHTDKVLRHPHGRLTLLLLWSSLVAVAAYIFSNHYFAGDARYLTIWMRALFLALAGYVSSRSWPRRWCVGVGAALALVIGLAVPAVLHQFNLNQQALSGINYRNNLVANAVARHGSSVLVGDYWRVVPTAFYHQNLSIMPLADCTTPRTTLTRSSWQYDLHKTRFAYLLDFDKSLTDYPQCSLPQVLAAFGHPNASTVIAGTLAAPHEMLLFYDHGIQSPSPVASAASPAVLPTSVSDYPAHICDGPTVMQIVAHEDDDLLFMNPDLSQDITAGRCIRTIYMTAGDGGHGQLYWLSRMRGSEAAYDYLLSQKHVWTEHPVRMRTGQVVTIASPQGNAHVSLIFMYLPDGNMKGQGFTVTNDQSLHKLGDGEMPHITTVYGGSVYTTTDIIDTLEGLMHVFQPSEVRTQSNYAGTTYVDHSDHGAAGQLAHQALVQYERIQFNNKVIIPLTYYLGYAGHSLAPNISGEALQQKTATFLQYAQFDGSVCHGKDSCMHDQAYGAYLTREYRWPF